MLSGPEEQFAVGGAQVVRSSDADEITLVGAGITLHEALAAADELAAEGTTARVIALYSINPTDEQPLPDAAHATALNVTHAYHHPNAGH